MPRRRDIPIRQGDEIAAMRRSCGVARDILLALQGAIHPGMTTGQIDHLAAELMRERGARSAFLGYRDFPGHICISLNEEVVHGIGGARPIQLGDLVKIDVGVIVDGWVGDNALSFVVGAAMSEEVNHLLETTEESLMVAIDTVRHGVYLGDVCAAIERVVVQNHLCVVRDFVGHGVGRQLHEEPQIPNFGRPGTGPKLKEGMILAIEPMVNMGTEAVKILADGWTVVSADKKPSAHFEHTVLVTRQGSEILTFRECQYTRLLEKK